MPEIEPFVFSEAVRHFWRTRGQQSQSQTSRGTADRGARSAVTGGKQMDGFIEKLVELMLSVGSAEDLWTAFRESAFGTSRPWLGYLFLLEDCNRSRSPVGVQAPHFAVLPEFEDASYSRRYELLCRKLVLERKYNAACFLTSAAQSASRRQNYTEPAEDLSARRFLASLLGHLAPPV